jgi:hypothetical protein
MSAATTQHVTKDLNLPAETIVQVHCFALKINLRIGPLNPTFLLWPEHCPIEMPTTGQLSLFRQKLYTLNGKE